MVAVDLPAKTLSPQEIKRLDDINRECITSDNKLNLDKVEQLGREAAELFEQGYVETMVYLHDYWRFHTIMNKGLLGYKEEAKEHIIP